MDPNLTLDFVSRAWDEAILPTLTRYVTIPNQSVSFDPEWAAHGHMDRAVALAVEWVKAQALPRASIEVWRLERRTPVVFVEVPGSLEGTVLLYGHLDKQPPMDGWEPGLGPWTPVLRDGKLYGRGAADDGYAIFAAVAATQALAAQGAAHPRLAILIECCEESGSPDLPAYIEAYAARIGSPGLVVCLDSGAGDYERLWLTTSLRGMVGGELSVELLREGVHSGRASGVVASSFRVLRALLSRLEDEKTGQILPAELHVAIPPDRVAQMREAAGVLGNSTSEEMPFHPGVEPVAGDPYQLLVNRNWEPELAVIGADGLPPIAEAGNVMRPKTAVKLSLRLPPTLDAERANRFLGELLTRDPPYHALVRYRGRQPNPGWNAPPMAQWLTGAVQAASRAFFGKDACTTGEGGSIPFMGMLGERFPEAQFMIVGVLGPASNAHGPNEFLHIPMAKRLTAAVAHVIEDYGRQLSGR
jgi:acetylornithine deacetylase/succinyl-diaminopimelate desuccinylase-like protein